MKLINQGKLSMVFTNIKSGTDWKTTDPDRGYALVQTKRNLPELGSDTFQLKLGNEIITFYAARRVKLNKKLKKDDITWDVFSISIPKKSKHDKDFITTTIKEAMKAFGFLYTTENVLSIKVNFIH
jgi:hypothetical protein